LILLEKVLAGISAYPFTMSSWSESRSQRRIPTSTEAWIEGANGKHIRCTLANVTLVGAQLQLEQHALVPSRFFVILGRDGKKKLDCQLVWRQAELLGIRFSEQPTSNSNKRMR
jgi:PilZ domain